MMLQESKKEIERLKQQFETAHTELKNKLEAAQAEKNFVLVVALLNEERQLIKENSDKMLAIIAASKS